MAPSPQTQQQLIDRRTGPTERPTLTLTETLNGKEFFIHGAKARIVFRRGRISVGCTDGEIEAIRELLKRYDEWISDREYVVQQP